MFHMKVLWVSLSLFALIRCDTKELTTTTDLTDPVSESDLPADPPNLLGDNVNETLIINSHEEGNGNETETEVYSYVGNLNFGDLCLSDAAKEDVLQNPRGRLVPAQLLERLKNESCNITKFLECRQVSVEQVIKPTNKSSVPHFQVHPVFKCSCPDYERIDSIHPKAYFDTSLDKCVLPARSKCSSFVIPASGQRYSGTILRKVVDSRTQPTSLPCVRNGVCFGARNDTTEDANENKCVCLEDFYPDDDNECVEIGLHKTASGALSALCLAILAFGLFFALMLLDGNDVWVARKHGDQDEIFLPGHDSKFHKKLFPPTKRKSGG